MIDRKKLTAWYDFMAPFYSRWRDDYDNAQLREVVTLAREQVRPERILDVGCGTGLFAIGLALAEPAWRVEALDMSAGMLDVARAKAAKTNAANVTFRQGDATEMPFEAESFDMLVAVGLFSNLDDYRPAIDEFHRVLRRDGHAFVVEFDRQAMTTATRMFFRVMILGYKTLSFFARRFRFADRWNLRTTTIDRARLDADLKAAGLRLVELRRAGEQLILHCSK